jgi:hypothetical protein
MTAQTMHNTFSLPWPHLIKKASGYVSPPQNIGGGAQPASLETESGKIILDENGNAIEI